MRSLPISLYQGRCSHVEFMRYPDGQQSCQLDMEYFNDVKLPVAINCSLHGFDDLERLLCLVAALQHSDFVVSSINFVYLFGMRSDRSFHLGQPNYFRDVLAPIINNIKTTHGIEVFYPHGTIAINYLTEACHSWDDEVEDVVDDKKYILIAGDRSAKEALCCNADAYFDKVRKDGRIASLMLYDKHHQKIATKSHDWGSDKPFLVIDDLCDGGATFEAEGKLLQLLWPERKRYLFVAHGLFTKGVDHLLAVFDEIITTNSYQPNAFIHDRVKVIEVIKP